MKKILNIFKNEKLLIYSILIYICLQPVLELDSYLTNFYRQTGILALSTSLRILGIAWIGILAYLHSKHKIRDFILWGIYGVILGAYTLMHFKLASTTGLELPASYRWVGSYELKYILYLVIPYIYIYSLSKIEIPKKLINVTIIFVSIFICLNIVTTNILLSSYGSYGNITYKNIFSWFSAGIYDEYLPKELTSIGFFFNANPMSGLLLIMYPLVINAYYEERSKLSLFGMIIHMIAMFMIGTRVGAFGTVLIMVPTIIAYLFFIIIKYISKLSKVFLGILVVFTIICSVMIPFSPGYMSAIFGYEDDGDFASREQGLLLGLSELDKIKDEDEYYYALVFQLEHIFIYYLTFPREYYEYYYSYKFDPYFYVDVLSLPFEQRQDGRDFQKFFSERKFNEMDDIHKMFGMGYSRMSQGGIVLEKDFARQYYVLGPTGMVVTVIPWIIICLYCGLRMLIKFKNKNIFNFRNTLYLMSLTVGLGAAYMSGHILDEPIASIGLAFAAGILIYNIHKKEETVND